MSLNVINEAIVEMDARKYSFGEEEKRFVLEFAFKSQDMELTQHLIKELMDLYKNPQEVRKKYGALLDQRPIWLSQIENLLVALEMYRVEEEKAINRLAEIMNAYNINISEEMLRNQPIEEIKEQMKKEISL